MRIASLIRCYGLTDYLRAVLKSYDWVDKVLVVNHRFINVTPREDKTKEIAESLGQKNIEVISGEDSDLHQALNYGLDQLKDYEFIFISDADELIMVKDQVRMIHELGDHDGAKCSIIDYARDYEHIFPERKHQPIVLAKQTLRFNDVRCSGNRLKSFHDIYVHHFGYVYKPDDMAWKINWEKPWEHNTVINLIAQIPQPYEMPQEIREMLNA